MADSLHDKDRVGSAYRCLGQLYLFTYSRYTEALQCVEQAIPIVQATGNRFEESCCYGLMGLEYGFRGRFEQSFAAFDSAVRAARAGEERSIECWNLYWKTEIQLVRGEWEAAVATAREGLALARRIENIWAVNWLTVVALHGAFMGKHDSVLIGDARRAVEALSGTTRVSNAWCYLADILNLSGHAEEATAAADRALAELEYGSYCSSEARAYRIKAATASRQADPDWNLVRRYMDKALRISRAQQRMPDLAVCQFRYAELQQRQGMRNAASLSLDEAEKSFAAMGMT